MIRNFTFNEMIKTDTGFDNTPNDMNIIKNLVRLTEFLQVIRDDLHLPIIVTSGYRAKEVNEQVGGVSSSYHCKGLAADIQCKDMDKLLMILREHLMSIDQLGIYYSGTKQEWFHVRITGRRKVSKKSNISKGVEMSSFYIVSTTNTNDKWLSTDNSYVLQKRIRTVIRDEYNNQYQIILDKGYRCDGLSVPKMFRWYLPSWDEDNQLYNLAGAIHDSLYTLKGANIFTREECDDVFRGLLRDSGIGRAKAGLADMAVGLFAGGEKHWGNDTWNNKDKIHVKLI